MLKRALPLPIHACGLLAAVLMAPSCLSLTPDAPPPTRWLSLMSEASQPGTSETGLTTPEPNVPSIRMGSVTASDAITDQLISRISDVELRYNNEVRWAESPSVMVQRALQDQLFQRQGFVFDAGASRRLDVEVITFEEHLVPRREGRVAVIAKLVDADGRALIHRRFAASIPVNGDDPALVAEALNEGMRRVVAEIGELMALK